MALTQAQFDFLTRLATPNGALGLAPPHRDSGLGCALAAAEGKVFGAGDFSMIEACVLLALAG
jgi:hypothetical protein